MLLNEGISFSIADRLAYERLAAADGKTGLSTIDLQKSTVKEITIKPGQEDALSKIENLFENGQSYKGTITITVQDDGVLSVRYQPNEANITNEVDGGGAFMSQVNDDAQTLTTDEKLSQIAAGVKKEGNVIKAAFGIGAPAKASANRQEQYYMFYATSEEINEFCNSQPINTGLQLSSVRNIMSTILSEAQNNPNYMPELLSSEPEPNTTEDYEKKFLEQYLNNYLKDIADNLSNVEQLNLPDGSIITKPFTPEKLLTAFLKIDIGHLDNVEAQLSKSGLTLADRTHNAFRTEIVISDGKGVVRDPEPESKDPSTEVGHPAGFSESQNKRGPGNLIRLFTAERWGGGDLPELIGDRIAFSYYTPSKNGMGNDGRGSVVFDRNDAGELIVVVRNNGKETVITSAQDIFEREIERKGIYGRSGLFDVMNNFAKIKEYEIIDIGDNRVGANTSGNSSASTVVFPDKTSQTEPSVVYKRTDMRIVGRNNSEKQETTWYEVHSNNGLGWVLTRDQWDVLSDMLAVYNEVIGN
jgi:hypothetical protein